MAQWVKNLPAMQDIQETWGLIPGLGRSPGEGNSNLLQYSCLENPMDRGAWLTTVNRVTKSLIQLSTQERHCKITKMVLVRSPMTNLKTTVRADCTVSACSPLPQPIKALTFSLSGGWEASQPLDRCPPSPPSCWHLKWSKLSFPPTWPVYWLLGSEQLHPTPFGNITIILLRGQNTTCIFMCDQTVGPSKMSFF